MAKLTEREAQDLLRWRYERGGYLRRKDVGPEGQKSAQWELRLYAHDERDRAYVVAALRMLGFRPGRAYAKRSGWVIPVYGRAQVERFLTVVAPRRKAEMPEPVPPEASEPPEGKPKRKSPSPQGRKRTRKIRRECVICGQPFETFPSRPLVTCREHRGQRPSRLTEVRCPECGKTFMAYPSEQRIYCSRACVWKNRHRRAAQTPSSSQKRERPQKVRRECVICGQPFETAPSQPLATCPEHRRQRPSSLVEVRCRRCGKTFTAYPWRRRVYCSRACMGKDRTVPLAEVRCRRCGKTFTTYPSIRRVYCSRACAGKSAVGRRGASSSSGSDEP